MSGAVIVTGHFVYLQGTVIWCTTYFIIASTTVQTALSAKILPDFFVRADMNRRYTEVSEGFCKVLGYRRADLIGKRVDDVTAPNTNDIEVVFGLFVQMRYMHGIWIFLHRSGTTRILTRYETTLVSDSQIDCKMELIGAGA